MYTSQKSAEGYGKEEGSRVTSVRIRCVYSNQINLQPTINILVYLYMVYIWDLAISLALPIDTHDLGRRVTSHNYTHQMCL